MSQNPTQQKVKEGSTGGILSSTGLKNPRSRALLRTPIVSDFGFQSARVFFLAKKKGNKKHPHPGSSFYDVDAVSLTGRDYY